MMQIMIFDDQIHTERFQCPSKYRVIPEGTNTTVSQELDVLLKGEKGN